MQEFGIGHLKTWITGDFYGFSNLGWRSCFVQRSCRAGLVHRQGTPGKECREFRRRAKHGNSKTDSVEHGVVVFINNWPDDRDRRHIFTIIQTCFADI